MMDKDKELINKMLSFFDLNQKLKIKYKTVNNTIFKNKHKNKRCFILGNGPSLNNQDLSKLQNEFVFTVNQISRHKDFKKIRPNYHFWADTKFFNIDTNKEEDLELLESMKSINTEGNEPICFMPISQYESIKRLKLEEFLNVFYFDIKNDFEKISSEEIDICKSIPAFRTVVQYAIACAIYMGFSEIYLLGCDCTGFLSFVSNKIDSKENVKLQYAYNISQNEKKRWASMHKEQDSELVMREWYILFKDYRLLNEYTHNRGIKLVNCTDGGILDSLHSIKFEDVI